MSESTVGSCASNPVFLDDNTPISPPKPPNPLATEILIYPSVEAPKAIITKSDLIRLAPDCYLNDSLIDFYCSYLLQTKASLETREKIHICSSLFYQQLKIPNAYHKQKWNKKQYLLQKKFLVIPLNDDYHWSLAIVANFDRIALKATSNNSENNDSTKPFIYHMDSFRGNHNRKRICERLRKYFTELIKNTAPQSDLSSAFHLSRSDLPDASIKVPQQNNFSDCGLYLLKFIELFLIKVEVKDSILKEDHTAIFSQREIETMREQIYALVYGLSGKKEYIAYAEFKEKYRNYFNENFLVEKEPKANSKVPKTKVEKLQFKDIKAILEVRDAVLIEKKRAASKSESLRDFHYNVVVAKSSSTLRYSLMLKFEQVSKLGSVKLVHTFFKTQRWRCQFCSKTSSFASSKCLSCGSEKIDLNIFLTKMRKAKRFRLSRALASFYGSADSSPFASNSNSAR